MNIIQSPQPAQIDISNFKLLDNTFVDTNIPSFSAYLNIGSSTTQVVSSSSSKSLANLSGKFYVSGTDQYIFGEKIYLETNGTPTDITITGLEVDINNYNTTGVYQMYGIGCSVNQEWYSPSTYAGYFSLGVGSNNANNSEFLSGVTSNVLTGHHCNTGRAVNFEAVLASAPSSTDVVANEVIGLNVWGVRNDKCTADKTYGVFLESFTKNGTGTWNHIYGIHANADTFINTADGWFLHSLSPVPSLLSGELRFAEVASEPANTPNGQLTIYALDDGTGKTQLMVKFPNGSSQQLAVEP